MNLRDLFSEIRSFLPENEAEMILMAALGEGEPIDHEITRVELFNQMLKPASSTTVTRARALAEERKQGRPLQHLLGFQEFLGRRFFVNSDVLIPRQETEALTAELINRLKEREKKIPLQFAIEVGLGSGAISISLLHEFENITLYSSEVSEAALDVVLRNLDYHSRNNPKLKLRLEVQKASDPLEVVEPFSHLENRSIDCVVSNPPYLIAALSETTEEVKDHEPQLALFAPEQDALYYYRKIAELAKRTLKPGGLLALEIPHERSLEIFKVLQWFQFRDIEIWKDLTGRDRGIFCNG